MTKLVNVPGLVVFAVACVVAVVLFGVFGVSGPSAQVVRDVPVQRSAGPAPAPRFVIGETYTFVWDCLPAWAAPPNVNPCNTERLTVRVVYSDGWLEVVDAEEERALGSKAQVWLANSNRAIAITVEKNPARRAA